MSDLRPEDFGETPTLEVRAYREGKLVERGALRDRAGSG